MLFAHHLLSNAVNVLIGSNGSGKSRMLRDIAQACILSGHSVIAVAPSIYDRFRGLRANSFKFYGARNGKAAACKVIQNALDRAYSEDPKVLRHLITALKYTGFDPVVGIRCDWVDLKQFKIISANLPRETAEEIESALLRWSSRVHHGEPFYSGIIRFELSDNSFVEMDSLSSGAIVRHEKWLRKHRIIPSIQYLLFREGEMVPLLDACSGELCFITTVAFIASEIKPGAIIVIDEPETSLHPTWQKTYIKTLLDLFHYYQPKIVISTHSPILISGAEVTSDHVLVYEVKDMETFLFPHKTLSLEEMYDRLFGIVTPKSYYLSQRAVKMLNGLNSHDRSLNQVLCDLGELREKSYDKSQQAVIARFEDMARKLDAIRREGA